MKNVVDCDATTLCELLGSNALSCEQLMTETLDRIEAVNPEINAVVSLRPHAELIAEARSADENPQKLPLHGLPVAIKDLADTRGIRSTSGSPIFADNIPAADCILASRIRAAGAIIIGKTNTPEFGFGSQSYNPVHGVTRNPYDRSKTAGGSSGGAAAALAARMVPVADGSDMMGSLRNPAAYCNVYGFRPTFGLVPGDPSGETFLHQLATNGPMARTVTDLALLLDVISGPEPGDPYSLADQPSFLDNLKPQKQKLRIGWLGNWNGYYAIDPEILELCEKALQVFSAQRHEVSEFDIDFNPDELWLSWTRLRSFCISDNLRELYDQPDKRRLLKPEAIYEIESGRSLSVDDIREASLIRSHWFSHMAGVFQSYDAVVLPSAQAFPFSVETHWPKSVNGKEMTTYHQWMEIVVPASLIGLPSINVPAGFSGCGLPMGMQIIGKRCSDQMLLNLANDYHQKTDWPATLPDILKG